MVCGEQLERGPVYSKNHYMPLLLRESPPPTHLLSASDAVGAREPRLHLFHLGDENGGIARCGGRNG